jgi:hypothetical protein
MCGDQLAVVWCVNDSAKLCESCDEQSHKHNHIHRKHQRIPLSDARAMMETCPDHPDVRVDYYCPLCQAPVCVNCKMTGHHSKGEAATHTLVSIGDVYRQAILATEKDDPIVVQRDDLIQQKFNEADRLLQEILENEQKVEAEIQKKAQAAIRQARQLAGEKALIVRSVQTELQRKQEEMKALTRSIQIHKTGSRPLAFLRASDRHALLVSSLQGPADLPASLTVRGDLEVRGDLSIEQSDLPQIPLELELPEEPLSPISQNLKSEPGCDIPSLALIAQRRERRNQELGIELTVQPFRGSKIITDQNVAKTLYLSLPFKVQPLTHLLFSSSRDGRSVRKMHEMIDGIGITAIIVRHGDFTFGGFAASKWNSNGKPFGDASGSFLFSLSQDAFISHRPETENPCVLCATEDTIAFGQCDLVISDDLDHCSSELENNYGVGWPHGSTEAQTFLAGQKSFAADEVEVWGFFTIEAE